MSNYGGPIPYSPVEIHRAVFQTVHSYFLEFGDPTPQSVLTHQYARALCRLSNSNICSPALTDLVDCEVLCRIITKSGRTLYYPGYLSGILSDASVRTTISRTWPAYHQLQRDGPFENMTEYTANKIRPLVEEYKDCRDKLLNYYTNEVKYTNIITPRSLRQPGESGEGG
jgi:hypothetical protein